MKYPEITSFDNGILVWKNFDEAVTLRIDGVQVFNGDDGLYHGDRIDLRKYGGAVRVELAFSSGKKTLALVADAQKRKVRLAPAVCAFESETGELVWQPACGALAYKAVDLDYGVRRITGTRYDLSAAKYAIAVLPVSDSETVGDAQLCDAENTVYRVKYLDGAGTADDPYRIRTAYDLRAIDCYEAQYAEQLKCGAPANVNHYRIERDINYGAIAAGDEDSNIAALCKPFFGKLDGNGKKLTNIRVRYDHGYWALFDFIVKGATVENIRFVRPDIVNTLKSPYHPIAAEIATVAYRNYGTIADITVKNAQYTASGGEVCGICSHNYGTITRCSVSGAFVQDNTGLPSQACYEMSGVALENRAGGIVENCTAVSVAVRGTVCSGYGGGAYFNVRTAAGIVAVNRAGGVVKNNGFGEVTLTNVNPSYEFGAVVAYNAGTIIVGDARLGKFRCNGADAASMDGTGNTLVGTIVGKNDGTIE